MGKPNEIIVTSPQTLDPSVLLSQAIERGIDTQALEKLMELNERYEKQQARKLFNQAMANFKKDPPKIFKDKAVRYALRTGGETSFDHASLGLVTEKISAALACNGLHASWRTKQPNGSVTVTCIIEHEAGHSIETELTAPPDDSGKKNRIQQIASTVTYLERYTLLALTGLATYEQDDDGQSYGEAFEPTITESAVADLQTMVDDLVKAGKLKSEEEFKHRLKKKFQVDEIAQLGQKQAEALANILVALEGGE
jgi:hypothetical protein